jgi:DNA-binding Xre family transcriptional regulator
MPRREIAIVDDYDGLHKVLRARAAQLRVSRLSLDFLGGLADGASSKILNPGKTRRMRLSNLGELCRALAVRLVVIDDPIQRERNDERVERRRESAVRHRASPQQSDSRLPAETESAA